MVRAWYMDDSSEDQRSPHMKKPGEFLTPEELYKLTGIEYFKIDEVDDLSNSKLLNELKVNRGYTYEDVISCSKESLPNFEEKLKSFFEEHLHIDEEIRLVLDGSGYFDARDSSDAWIRVEVTKGDMITLPAGVYHRFTLDSNNFIKAKRFFIGEPRWTPYNRPLADVMDARKEYLKKLASGSL